MLRHGPGGGKDGAIHRGILAAEVTSGHRAPTRRAVALLAVGAVIAASLLVLFMVRPRGLHFPDEVAGYPRMTSKTATRFEDLLSRTSIGGLQMRGTVYGNGDHPSAMVFVYVAGLPADRSLDGLLRELTGSGTGPAGSASATREGVQYLCSPSADPAHPGTSCVFSDGKVVGGVSFFSPTDPRAALDIARDAYRGVT